VAINSFSLLKKFRYFSTCIKLAIVLLENLQKTTVCCLDVEMLEIHLEIILIQGIIIMLVYNNSIKLFLDMIKIRNFCYNENNSEILLCRKKVLCAFSFLGR